MAGWQGPVKFSNAELEELLPHIFLPRKLPDKTSDKLPQHEANLLRLMRDNVIEAAKEASNNECLNRTASLFTNWCDIQQTDVLDPKKISESVNSLKAGNSFALYIRAQNACWMISIPEDQIHKPNTAILSTFPASARSEDVMSTSSDLLATCPTSSIHIPFSDFLCSETFGRQLAALCSTQCDIAMQKTKKAGRFHTEIRDVSDPLLITKLITAMLTNKESEICSHFPKITKKVRDQINWKEGSKLPFRRSGMWFTAKVVLQLSLINGCGEIDGTFLYKMILLRVMLHSVKHLKHENLDTSMQLIAKMGHRLCKLEFYVNEHQDTNQLWRSAHLQLRETVVKQLKLVHEKLESRWNDIVNNDIKEAKLCLPLSELDFIGDTKHRLKHCLPYFSSQKQHLHMPNSLSSLLKYPPRLCTDQLELTDIPLSHFNANGEETIGIVLCDFEQYVHKHLDTFTYFFNCQTVRELFEAYIKKAKSFYADDPVGSSQMFLCSLKIIKILDKVAAASHPLLKNHRSGVDTNLIKDLLLVKYEDMEVANDLENYFNNRNKSIHPSLIEEETISEHSFSALYARQDKEMCRIREEIMADAERKIEQKKQEVQRVKNYVRELKSQADDLSHTYISITDQWECAKEIHEINCEKCSLEKKFIDCKIRVYERPLPSDFAEQCAVIFELRIPEEIACLRDALYFFRSEVCGSSVSTISYYYGRTSPLLWTSYQEISRYHQKRQKYVQLGSSTKLFVDTNYSVLSPDSTDDLFIVNNGYNCRFMVGSVFLGKPESCTVKEYCTFSIPQVSKYKSLEWTMSNTTHSQNKVFAEQAKCPKNLSLSEFKEFGSLRAGHRLQMRNIYRALQQDSLSLHEEPVFRLICQSIWEAGPQASPSVACRDSHLDLEDSNFSKSFIQLLCRVLDQQSKNWMNYNTLLNIIVLTARTFSLSTNAEVKSDSLVLLIKCRDVANSWSYKVENLVKTTKDASIPQTKNLRLTLIHINVCLALTFLVDVVEFPRVMNSDEAVECWLKAIAKIKDNIILSKTSVEQLHVPLRNMLRWVRNIGVSMETHLHKLLQSCKNGFESFAKSNLPGSQNGYISPWVPCDGQTKQVYKSSFSTGGGEMSRLYMDVICGDFLVDGCTVGYLPLAVTSHKDFQSIFSDTTFEVKPSDKGTLVTGYCGRTYGFSLCDGNQLVVTETQEDGSQYQLIPQHVFDGDIPILLKDNYSHWWNRTNNTVLFRPKTFQDKNFLTKVSYILDLHTNILQEVSTNRHIIDITSHNYQSICEIMARLEFRSFVHVLYSAQEGCTFVELPRMALQFEIDCSGHLKSREYPGMRVKENQKFGTLVGLKQGLLLESLDASPKLNPVLLVPHGNIVIIPKINHQHVDIEIAKLRQPEFFAFEIDERLRQLRAGQSQTGWLYLALLHAVTASPLPDPFTGFTGTESAFYFLQSAHCWSSQPLTGEANEILKQITALSPIRVYCPKRLKCMEKVEWPLGLGTLAAHDGYQVLVKKLFDDSQRLAFLYKDRGPVLAIKYNNILVHKSYWRSYCFYTEQARVFPEFDDNFLSSPSPNAMKVFDIHMEASEIKAVQTMAHLSYAKETTLPPQSNCTYLESLLIANGGSLEGVQTKTLYPIIATRLFNFDFKAWWLDLYTYALNVKRNRTEHEWTVLLCTLAFGGTSLTHLQILHAIAAHPQEFSPHKPPSYSCYFDVSKNEYDSDYVKAVIKNYASTLDDYILRTNQRRRFKEEEDKYKQRERKLKQEHDSLVTDQVNHLAQLVEDKWPTKSFSSDGLLVSEIDILNAERRLNITLDTWYMNLKLKCFIRKVEQTVFQLKTSLDLVHTILTQSATEPFKQNHQHDFFKISLSELLKTKDKDRKASEERKDENGSSAINSSPKEAAEIFCTGQMNPNLFQYDTKQPSSNGVDTKPFPWPVDDSCEIRKTYMNDNMNSWKVFQKQRRETKQVNTHARNLVEQLEKACTVYAEKGNTLWNAATIRLHEITKSFSMEALRAVGLFPRINPATMLPLICVKQLDERFCNYIGSTAVVWTLEQQANRCLKYAKAGDSMTVALQNELVTAVHKCSWSPKEKPEWLLLELEMDLKIRPIQVKVANAMIEPENGAHSVMQLNMGEGKTSVIIPFVVAVLANEVHLCRVTVLKALLHMNREALSFKMGGMLNRRVYMFPCRRDMVIGGKESKIILQLYQECLGKRGIVLTLPEYRLSFQLKGYEFSRNGNFQMARPLLEIQDWLNEHVRDVLDESDAILHFKYQLVYTIGEQIPVDGESLRWTVAQNLLKLVPPRLSEIMKRYGGDAAECADEKEHPERFPHCRLLSMDFYTEFCGMLVTDIFDGALGVEFPDLPTQEKVVAAKFLSSAIISEEDREKSLAIFDLNTATRARDTVLILRGLLACGVLALVLNKRWRVNYGVNEKGPRLMAVPFRAKDVAAERTEFGHPDVAILTTILSYYYSGLTDKQLEESFQLLYRQQNCEEEYTQWVSKVHDINPSIKTLNGVNLADYSQRSNDLHPVLLKNTAVINFWLNKTVFPKESKQFGHKMLCTAWDLCSDGTRYPVTGFSGTNDTKLLLPISISQNDLPELLGTNGEVLHNLLLSEKKNYRRLPEGTSNLDILEELAEENISLLLDVGALMTEYSNAYVAWKWLNVEHIPKKEAAIYIDKEDKLMVIDRRGQPCLFELSPYRQRMEECVIYLDDFHTRGTDLKLPLGTKGCVTLGKGVTKDKLVQGCMRMRMLGHGHTVCFLASMEVNREICKLTGKKCEWKINVKDVLTWAMENSRLLTRDGFLYWTSAGCNYTMKKMAHCRYDLGNKSKREVQILGELCSDKEVTELMKMHGLLWKEELFPILARSCLKAQLARFEETAKGSPHASFVDARNVFGKLEHQILNQCQKYVPTYKRLSHMLDEEQERELEHELEEERSVPRPPAAIPADSHLDNRVVEFVRNGTFSPDNSWVVKLPHAFRNTKIWRDVQADCWGENIYATKDFVTVVVIQNQNDCVDQFLRPPVWVAALRQEDTMKFLLLSPYEINSLLPLFRSQRAAAVLHMYSARLRADQDTLILSTALSVPSSSTVTVNYPNFDIITANLSLFSGSMYFADENEQNAYIRFLGLIPHPRTKKEQEVHDNGGTCNGFVKPDFRNSLPYLTSQFERQPGPLIQGIIERRYDFFPSRCHVAKLVVTLRKPFTQGV